ncbi:MAG: hypothetical protein AMXMBFR7_40090 [Planctomycetota bacterium]
MKLSGLVGMQKSRRGFQAQGAGQVDHVATAVVGKRESNRARAVWNSGAVRGAQFETCLASGRKPYAAARERPFGRLRARGRDGHSCRAGSYASGVIEHPFLFQLRSAVSPAPELCHALNMNEWQRMPGDVLDAPHHGRQAARKRLRRDDPEIFFERGTLAQANAGLRAGLDVINHDAVHARA